MACSLSRAPRRRALLVLILVFFAHFVAVTKTRQQDNFYFDPAPRNQDVVEGGKVILRCDVSNRRHITFYWTLGSDDKRLPNTSRRFQEDSDLHIVRVSRQEDAGSFRCVATNVTTGVSRISTEAQLNILCE
ncbi:hypothetical protein NP493_161g04000 [Ridgeia piscesae]|uniref:Ig-like domain-containing protein n=1 Tax=Ridgeia piscesae TaxID=27915 RepID=A0AAD9P3Y9_RIDPI|nr:hypothetical protein NP493_161g04000 [Ridgeia piscesae]